MNLGKIVRAKMKELAADKSGQYLDNQGRHFSLSADGDGYAISYGGEKGKKISVTREVGAQLAAASKRLAEEKKRLKKRVTRNEANFVDRR